MVDALGEQLECWVEKPKSSGEKIRPQDYPGVYFSIEVVDWFIRWYDKAVEVEGANRGNMVFQIVNFILNKEELRDVEGMDGYEEKCELP